MWSPEVGWDAAEDIVYKDYLGAELFHRTDAKPLIVNYTDGHVVGVDEVPGFIGHGQRDAWAAVSLDDGASWMRTNLSRSGTKEITITTEGQPFTYYGDVTRMYTHMAGNKVLAIWISRLCGGGKPAYLLDDGDSSTDNPTDPLTGCPIRTSSAFAAIRATSNTRTPGPRWARFLTRASGPPEGPFSRTRRPASR